MIVPYKPIYFKRATKPFKYIIIHDLSCKFGSLSKAKVDTNKMVASYIRNYNWILNDEYDLPYHFLCEKIGKEHQTLLGTPFCYYCMYDDIPSQYQYSIHIAVAGDYSIIRPAQQTYQQIGYRSIASILKWFSIPFNNILFHNEISTDKENSCPGTFFNKQKFMSAIRPMILTTK